MRDLSTRSLIASQVTVAICVTALAVAGLGWFQYQQIGEDLKHRVQHTSRLLELVAFSVPEAMAESDPATRLDLILLKFQSHLGELDEFGQSGQVLLGQVRDGRSTTLTIEPPRTDSGQTGVLIREGVYPPLSQALKGHSGLALARDDNKALTLSYSEWNPLLGCALAAKQNLSELALPFLQAGLIVALTTLLAIGLGSLLYEASNRRMLAEAKRAKHWLEEVVDFSPAVIFVKDLEGRYTMVNNLALAFLGRAREELIGHADREFLKPELADRYEARDRWVVESGKPERFEEEIESASGRQEYLFVRFPLRGSDGRVEAVGGVGIDVSEQKRAAEVLGRLAVREGEMKAFRAITATYAHELNSPLTGVLGILQMLAEEARTSQDDQPDKLALLEDGLEATQKMAKIIEQLCSSTDLRYKDYLGKTQVVEFRGRQAAESKPE